MKIPKTPFTTTELFKLNDKPYSVAAAKEIGKILRSEHGLEKYPTRHYGRVQDCWKPKRPVRDNNTAWIYTKEEEEE